MKLSLDDRTAESDFTVSANEGVVTVTYMPRQSQAGRFIPEVLADLEGTREILATMAETNILWIQEKYDPGSEAFIQINQIAQRWGAAVELLRFIPSEEVGMEAAEEGDAGPKAVIDPKEYTGGIEDDEPEKPPAEDGGLGQTLEELIRQGRSGGGRLLAGNFKTLSSAVSRNINYSLVVIGGLFLNKPKAAQTRMLRDLKVYLSERIRVPVISSDELQEKYFVGGKQLIQFFGFMALVACAFWGVFSHQEAILNFLLAYKGAKFIAVVAVGLFAPIFAYFYGTIAHLFLKMIKFD